MSTCQKKNELPTNKEKSRVPPMTAAEVDAIIQKDEVDL